jgi:hypothetical protein
MSQLSTTILLPFLAAFLVFSLRFYAKEGANHKLSPSFLLAITSMVIAGAFLFLGITHRLPEYGVVGFGIAGVALFVLSVVRMFQL